MTLLSDLQMFVLSLRFQDFIDFVVVWYVIYLVLLLVRRTGSVQILSGMGVVAILFILSTWWELVTLNWLLEKFFSNLFLIAVILFQGEIRRALAHMGSNKVLSGWSTVHETHVLEVISKGAITLAQNGLGALIVLERDISLDYFIEIGTEMDSTLSPELLVSIFQPSSPLHDGGAVVRGGRLFAAGCFLPLSKNTDLSKQFGTRHRAAIGLTEETDAVVIVVSEETQSVGLAIGGVIHGNLSHLEIRQILYREFGLSRKLERVAVAT